MYAKRILALTLPMAGTLLTFAPASQAGEYDATLAAEVAEKGWIVYSARADNATWDLFLIRPDGSAIHNLTRSPDYEEAAPRFSPDGTRLLYRRMARGTTFNHDKWGFSGQLVIAKPDAAEARVLGEDGDYPWAAWMPDGKHVSCLYREGIRIVDVESGEVVRELPRNGIYQQLFPSPDGKWFCGTGNVQNAAWNVVRMNAETGEVNAVQIFQSCTPNWFPDSTHLIYSSRPGDQRALGGYGATQLWMADGNRTGQQLVYGDDAYHIYGGEVSPDGAYVLFTKSLADGGGSEKEGAPIFLMRLSNAPAVGGDSAELRAQHPNAMDATLLELPHGWEPNWTYADVGAP